MPKRMFRCPSLGSGAIAVSASLMLATSAVAGGEDPGPGMCCGTRPAFESPDYAAFGGGAIGAATHIRDDPGGFVLQVIDLSNQNTAPLNSNWNAASFYSHPDWTLGTLGSVFGVTIDDVGNIYVAHSSAYSSDPFVVLDTPGIGGPGAVYRVSATTGAVSVLATLPNTQDPSITPASEAWPGLGNLHFDCDRQVLYVTNHDDGRIYRLDPSGACLSTYDHATDTVGSCAPETGDADGFAPLGERLWAVQAHNGRVYYSVWWEDSGRPNGSEANEVWSVACDANGDFIAGTQQLEVSVPPLAGISSNPVSDISFGPNGCMLLGERSMNTDTIAGAHASRVLEYCWDGASASWAPSANTFLAGDPNFSSLTNSCAGGVDYDYAPNGRVWASGDALQFGPEYIYGIIGFPATGGDPTTSILVDLDQDVALIDKYQVGDIEISCPESSTGPCLEIRDEEILCDLDDSGSYTYTFDISNFSGVTAHWLLVPAFATVPNDSSVTLSPNVIPLVPPLPGDGSQSATVSLTISGGIPGDTICFDVILADENVEECCAEEICVELPRCDCVQIRDELIEHVECLPDGTVSFSYTFTLDNLSGQVIEHAFLLSLTTGVTFVPDYFDLPSVPDNGSTTITTQVTGALPGQEICFLITVHDESLNECCSIEHCFVAPDCPVGDLGGCIFCDFSCIDTTEDECALLAGYFCGIGQPCDPSCLPQDPGACCLPDGTCVEIDRCECELSQGIFSPGASCPPPGVAGACCLPDGTCFETDLFCECAFNGGSFVAGMSCQQACGGATSCPGDCNGDELVNVEDLVAVILDWGECPAEPCPSDFNDDGVVDVQDMVDVILNWGPCEP